MGSTSFADTWNVTETDRVIKGSRKRGRLCCDTQLLKALLSFSSISLSACQWDFVLRFFMIDDSLAGNAAGTGERVPTNLFKRSVMHTNIHRQYMHTQKKKSWLWVTPLLFSLSLVSRMYTEMLCICCCALRYIFILSSQMFKWCSHIVFHSQWEAGNSQLLGYHYNLSVCSCAVQLGKTCEETLAAAKCSFKCVPHTTADNVLAIFCKHSQQACSTLCL